MLGRYVVELLLVLLCGMGIHADEVARVGGPEVFIRFNQVGVLCVPFALLGMSTRTFLTSYSAHICR